LAPEDYAIDDVEVWPENWPAFCLFVDMRTQWRVGFAGPTGLDYGVLFGLMDMHAVPASDRPQLLADLQVLEAAALKAMAVKYD
jgi:hypothetical protein